MAKTIAARASYLVNQTCCGQPEKTAKFEMRYFAPADISISGQRVWMAKAAAGLAGVPA